MQKENNEFYVYEWIRVDTNEPFYIGKGKNYRCYVMNRNNYFNNIINKIDCAVYIMHDNLTEEEAFQYECWYIHEYKYEIGYELANITDGGEGGDTFSQKTEEEKNIIRQKMSKSNKGKNKGKSHPISIETRKKLSEANKGRIVSSETRWKISKSNKGKIMSEESRQKSRDTRKGKIYIPWNKGKENVYSQETLELMSESRKGKGTGKRKPLSEETKQHLREINLGRKHTEETKRKMSESRKGEKNHMFGKPKSEEVRKKISKSVSEVQKIRFTIEQINDIIKRINNKETLVNIAKSYNCSRTIIYRIIRENNERILIQKRKYNKRVINK